MKAIEPVQQAEVDVQDHVESLLRRYNEHKSIATGPYTKIIASRTEFQRLRLVRDAPRGHDIAVFTKGYTTDPFRQFAYLGIVQGNFLSQLPSP